MRDTGLRLACMMCVLAMAGAAPALADGCTAECSTEIGCHGSCSVDPPDGCGAICWGSCEVTCRGSGPPRFSCSDVFTQFRCLRQPPPNRPSALGGNEWAVIDVWTDGRQAVGVADTKIVAASSGFGESAVLEVLGQENDRIAKQRADAQARGATLEEFLAGGERRRTTGFFVAGGVETAVAAEAELISRQFPLKVERGTAIYFRGYTEAKSDVVAYVEVLYAREPELTDAFVEFIEQNLRVRSRRNPAAPLEFYGVVGIAGRGPEAWFSIAGASELQAFVPPREPGHPDTQER